MARNKARNGVESLESAVINTVVTNGPGKRWYMRKHLKEKEEAKWMFRGRVSQTKALASAKALRHRRKLVYL